MGGFCCRLSEWSCRDRTTSPGGRVATALGVNKVANIVLGFTINKNKLLLYTALPFSLPLPPWKISISGFNSTRTVNYQMYKLELEKPEEPEIKLPTSVGSSEKQESSRKTSTSALLTMPKSLAVWTTTNCGKFFKKWEYQTI